MVLWVFRHRLYPPDLRWLLDQTALTIKRAQPAVKAECLCLAQFTSNLLDLRTQLAPLGYCFSLDGYWVSMDGATHKIMISTI